MIKFFLGLAIVAFTTFCGYLFAKKYRKRKLFFTQLSLFNERFISEVSYYRRPLYDFISKYVYKGEFSVLLERFTDCVNKRIPLRGNFLDGEDFHFLKREEKTLLEDYFHMLGKGDSASQKTYFCSVKDTLKNAEKEANSVCKKYGDLYIKIGFLCGLLILILIL